MFSIVKWTIISLTLIFLMHHLYTFLMNTLTVPKIKDLVNKPKEQYKDLFQTMQQGTQIIQGTERIQGNERIQGTGTQGTETQGISTSNKEMTDELSSFLNDLKKKGGENYPIINNNIAVVENFNSGNAFSAF